MRTTTIIKSDTNTMWKNEYYSGNWAYGFDPTPGIWDGNIFTAADGGKWTFDTSDDAPHPATDGSGVHHLIPADITKTTNQP